MSGISVSHVFLEEDDSFDFLDGFEAKSPQHLALRPMYVRSYTPVPSQHVKVHSPSPSKPTQSPSSKTKTAPLQLRGTDMIRLYNSECSMNTWDSSHTEQHLAMPRKQLLARQPRPKSYTPRQNSEYI
ncbi:Sodium/potassium-transporting ATPase subunit beta-1-interacting protein [Zootermopsis nevadensis]|uniref:Sodium/potassium-transporting ATPase subunit beta-1-interacting protein n=1 Tax=Zootermopsis nevadensis TaxID=136037 RepID=A0A067QVT7_ZOONE|nr:Sodium/potassium-transporting ATPase subunit beta-1-interacting protein [Zootermopsis nevadensis]